MTMYLALSALTYSPVSLVAALPLHIVDVGCIVLSAVTLAVLSCEGRLFKDSNLTTPFLLEFITFRLESEHSEMELVIKPNEG